MKVLIEKAVIEQALEAFGGYDSDFNTKHYDLIVALREALAEQAEQEPIRFVWNGEGWVEADKYVWETTDDTERRILFTAPQPVQSLSAQDLNDLEIETKWAGDSHEFERIVNAAVAKLKPVRTKDLTDEEIWAEGSFLGLSENAIFAFARAVIAAYKEKNK